MHCPKSWVVEMISHDTAKNPYFPSGKNGRINHFEDVLGVVGTISWQCTRWVPIIRNTLGSGVTNINKYLPYYAKGAKPRFEETRHGFELTIPLVDEVTEIPPHGQRQTDAGGRGMRNFNREIRKWGRMSQTLESPLCILLDILGPEAKVSNSIPAKPLPSMLNCGGFFFSGGNCP